MISRSGLLPVAAASSVIGLGLGAILIWPSMSAPALGLLAGLAFSIGLYLSPGWAVFAFVAFPPGVLILATSDTGGVLVVQYFMIVCGLAVAMLNRRSIGDKRFVLGFGALTGMLLLSHFFVPVPGARDANAIVVNFVYYISLYLLVLNVAPLGSAPRAAYVSFIQLGLLISVLITGGIALTQVGWGFLTQLTVAAFPEDAGFLYTRTHFGYIMALGAALALPRLVLRIGKRLIWLPVTVAALLFVVLSVTRGAWITVLIFVVILAFVTKSWKLLLLLPAVPLLYAVPGVQARLTSDLSGGLSMALQTGQAGSHRVLLWSILWSIAIRSPVFGHGVGFVSSISPSLIFGEGQFVAGGNPLVYAHNDFLFLFLERGILAVALYAYAIAHWWRSLVARIRRVLVSIERTRLALLLSCVGIGLTTLIAQLVDNGFFINALYERFIVAAACASLLTADTEVEVENGDES